MYLLTEPVNLSEFAGFVFLSAIAIGTIHTITLCFHGQIYNFLQTDLKLSFQS